MPESALFIRLYLDEDVHRRVAVALRLRHFDVVSAHEVGRWGLSDEEQLTLAAAEGRALFTFNPPDYLRLHLNWLQLGKDHSGITVSDQLPVGETIRRLLNLLNRV
ncbi:MAG: DUF5615 family PIN-like protein, partial [Chloroflexota bacterium]